MFKVGDVVVFKNTSGKLVTFRVRLIEDRAYWGPTLCSLDYQHSIPARWCTLEAIYHSPLYKALL